MTVVDIKSALALIFQGISQLQGAFPHRKFTIDGRLVGDLGEVIAELAYDLTVDATSQARHDGTTSDNRRVQIKATFKEHLTFGAVPDFYLGLKLNEDGSFTEVFNGPGTVIHQYLAKRKNVGLKLISVSNSRLSALSATVPESQRVRRREGVLVAQ